MEVMILCSVISVNGGVARRLPIMGRKELVTSPVGEGPARSHCAFQGSILVRFIVFSYF